MLIHMALVREPFFDMDEMWKEVEGRTQIKRETIATLQGISLSQWSQQLHGVGQPSMTRIMSMAFHDDPDGRRAVLMFFHVAAERLGLPYEFDEVTEAALTMAVALRAKLRMARAALIDAQERRRA